MKNGYVDQANGDYYIFKQDHDSWVNTCNIGIHYTKAAELQSTKDKKFIKSSNNYARLNRSASQQIVTSKISEK